MQSVQQSALSVVVAVQVSCAATSSSAPVGLIVGVTVGGVAAAVGLVVLIVWATKRQAAARDASNRQRTLANMRA